MGKKDELHLLFDRIVGSELARFREKMGFVQQDFARMSGELRQWISRIETGKTTPGLYKFFQYTNATDVDVVELIKNIRDKYVKETKPIMMAAEEAKYRKYLEQAKKKRSRKAEG